jgi:hypothetical protein
MKHLSTTLNKKNPQQKNNKTTKKKMKKHKRNTCINHAKKLNEEDLGT